MSATTTTPTITPAATTPVAAADPETGGTRRVTSLLGGASLVLAPLLIAAGTLTAPPQASNAPGDYITSLARDPFLSGMSANFYHYGWIAMALGLLAGIGLVRGRKGRVLALVGGIGGALGAMQISGLLLNDWFLSSLGTQLPLDQAVSVFLGTQAPSIAVWKMTAQVGAIGLPVVFYAGMARAGVISWWLVPLTLGGMVLPFVIAGLIPGVAGVLLGLVVGLACGAATFLTGWRLIQRSRLA